MAYTPTDWKDGQAGGTPITAAELTRVDSEVAALAATVDTGRLSLDGLKTTFVARDNLRDAASEAVLDLARRDGWAAVYDPTNPKTRHLLDGRIAAIEDGLGNFPALTQPDPSLRPEYAPGEYGELAGGRTGQGGNNHYLWTFGESGVFDPLLAQPNFIMALARADSADLGDTSRVLLDGTSGARNAILASTRGVGGYGQYAGYESGPTVLPLDTDPHLVGVLYAGRSGTTVWQDGGVSPQAYGPGTGGNDAPMGGLIVGQRFASNGTHWVGTFGPVLVYDGEPSAEVRERMTRLVLSLSRIGTHNARGIAAAAALSVDRRGVAEYGKNADDLLAPASTLKVMTSYVARQTITDALLDTTTTVTSDDLVGGSTAHLQAGDVITYRDLFYAVMLPSGNDAATCLARSVGAILDPDSLDPLGRFLTEMDTVARGMGWTGHVFPLPTGLSTQTRMSPWQLTDLLLAVAREDPFLLGVMGALTHTITITGTNARTRALANTFEPDGAVKFPEFIAGKTGTLSSRGSLAMLWRHPDGTIRASALLQSNPVSARFGDMRTIVDAAIAQDAGAVATGEAALARALDDPTSSIRVTLDHLYRRRDVPVYAAISRGDLPDGTDLDDLYTAEDAGVWRLTGSSTYPNHPAPTGNSHVLEVWAGDGVNATVQRVSIGHSGAATGVYWREANIANSTTSLRWSDWARVTDSPVEVT